MYYIAVNDGKDDYHIEQALEDWHDGVDGFEPIDCIDGAMIIYDESGHKFLIGPNKELEKTSWSVDVGTWDFAKGEPFLIDTDEIAIEELHDLLNDFKTNRTIKGLFRPQPRVTPEQAIEAAKHKAKKLGKAFPEPLMYKEKRHKYYVRSNNDEVQSGITIIVDAHTGKVISTKAQ